MSLPRFDLALTEIQRRLGEIRGVRNVVLFGSVARGTPTPGSDVDLLIDCTKEARRPVFLALFGIERTHGISISPVFVPHEELERTDRQFLESVLRDGRPLVGAMPRLTPSDLGLRPFRAVSYWAEKLPPARRARFLRELDGSRTRKRVGKRNYVSQRQGLIERSGGWRAGRGAVMVPEAAWPSLDEVFGRFGVRRTAIAVWVQEP